jgi:hypothetical protein
MLSILFLVFILLLMLAGLSRFAHSEDDFSDSEDDFYGGFSYSEDFDEGVFEGFMDESYVE